MLKTHFRTAPLKLASVLTLGLLLGACGGGSGSQVGNKGGISSSSAASTSSVDTTQIRNLGRGTGADFVAGEIGVGIGSGSLSAGGTTILTVNAVSGSGNLVTDEFDVKFNSACIAAGKATLSFAGSPLKDGIVETNSGQASVVYNANGCVGSDQVTATANYKGEVLSASTILSIESDTVGSIQFLLDENDEYQSSQLIYLKGTGGPETTRVSFLVTGGSGSPVEGVCVDFSLNTSVGGLALVSNKCEANDAEGSTRAKSDTNGIASILIRAGNIPTPVVITAKDASTGLATQSRGLRIATGIPDQKSMTIGVHPASNPSGWDHNGEEVVVTVGLADAFNNPPIAGTRVSFTTSGGVIEDSCFTNLVGECSVKWLSRNPRPINGLAVILAHTTGNESFKDDNSNGWYDLDVDIFKAPRTNPTCRWNTPPSTASESSDACDDLPEAYRDANYNGIRDNSEFFIDFDGNNQHNSLGDEIYNGVLCRPDDATNGKCTRSGVTIREDAVITMSSDRPYFDENSHLLGQPNTVSVAAKAVVQIQVLLADINGNSLPAGTEVRVRSGSTDNVDISAPNPLTIPSGSQPQYMTIILTGNSDTDKASGFFHIEIEAPKGLTTTTAPTFFN